MELSVIQKLLAEGGFNSNVDENTYLSNEEAKYIQKCIDDNPELDTPKTKWQKKILRYRERMNQKLAKKRKHPVMPQNEPKQIKKDSFNDEDFQKTVSQVIDNTPGLTIEMVRRYLNNMHLQDYSTLSREQILHLTHEVSRNSKVINARKDLEEQLKKEEEEQRGKKKKKKYHQNDDNKKRAPWVSIVSVPFGGQRRR